VSVTTATRNPKANNNLESCKLLHKADGSTAQSLRSEFARPAMRRLQVVAMAMALAVLLLSFVMPLITGALAYEFASLDRWLPDVLNIIVSLGVFGLARSERVSAKTMVNMALVYQVVAAIFISLAIYTEFVRDVVEWNRWYAYLGPGWVAVWMMFFAVLVPTRPGKALMASLATAATVPLTLALLPRGPGLRDMSAMTFFEAWVLPYLVVTATAYFANSVLYRMSQDVQRAHELGSYHLEEKLGSGGMGEVWRAHHRMLARPAAIKMIRSDVLRRQDGSGTALERFAREAEATAELQSPHTVNLYDFGVSGDGRLYYVMELLDGVDLQTLVEQFGPMEQERVVRVLRQVCQSLEEAHQHGLIHRDIKPANIVLTRFALETDFVKVLDFGLVKRDAELTGEAANLSQTGQISGTPAYLAPEVALDEATDGRADLYSLGCTAYWMLTGEPVFDESTPMKMVIAHVTRKPPPLRDRMVDPPSAELEALVMSCLAKDPNDRPASAAELAEQLEMVDLPRPWNADRAAAWWQRHDGA
jgi:eukaryotic-like serine/threonine-protein kinase